MAGAPPEPGAKPPSGNLSPVKLLRIWFVVLLAVLLPIRGAMAATMPCAPAGGPSQGELHVLATASNHGHGHVHGGEHAEAAHAAGHAAHDHGGDASAGHGDASPQCNMCPATCSTPPLPSARAGLDEPTAVAAAPFPHLSAPAPTFQSDGQERPPRRI